MPNYQVSIKTCFTAGHALKLPDGSYEPAHRHDWPVTVTLQSESLDAMDCVMDFHELEKIVAAVVGPWEGKHLNDVPPFENEAINPSAERVAEQIGLSVVPHLQPPVSLLAVNLGEAPGCTATFKP